MRLADIFSGEHYWLTPGEDFVVPADKEVVSWQEDKEYSDEELGPYETPRLRPWITPKNLAWGMGKFSEASRQKHIISNSWSGMNISCQTLVRICGGKFVSYQRPSRDENIPDRFEMQFIPDGEWDGVL